MIKSFVIVSRISIRFWNYTSILELIVEYAANAQLGDFSADIHVRVLQLV